MLAIGLDDSCGIFASISVGSMPGRSGAG